MLKAMMIKWKKKKIILPDLEEGEVANSKDIDTEAAFHTAAATIYGSKS